MSHLLDLCKEIIRYDMGGLSPKYPIREQSIYLSKNELIIELANHYVAMNSGPKETSGL